MVDAAAEDTWDEAAGALTSLLAAESSWGIPLAVLANKVDALGDLVCAALWRLATHPDGR